MRAIALDVSIGLLRALVVFEMNLLVACAIGCVVLERAIRVFPISIVQEPAADHEPRSPFARLAVNHGDVFVVLLQPFLDVLAKALNVLKHGAEVEGQTK